MRVHAHESDVLVRYLKRREFIVSRAKCSLDHHKISGRSECLADEGRIPLGALAGFIICSHRRAIGLYVSSAIVDLS